MKKLRCENCGGELTIEENGDYATCGYCKTKYKLNEDKTITIKLDDDIKNMYMDTYKTTSKIFKPVLIIILLISFITIIGIVFGVSKGVSFGSKSAFNSKFENRKGTESYTSVGWLLDDVSTNNQKNKRKINVVYNDKSYVDSNEIIALKKELGGGGYSSVFKQFEVKFEYDKKGYINKVIIEDIN